MKKNIMMRISAILLVAVLLTTCVISGTFAKYVTSDDGQDSAEVAKWGVTVTVEGDETDVSDTAGDVVESHIISNDGELLAPGTKGTLGKVTIEGTPDVACRVTYTATVSLDGWTVNTSEYYCPLIVYVNGVAVAAGADAAAYEANIKAAIEAYSADIAAGKDLTDEAIYKEVVITWAWAFESGANEAEIAANNVKDTQLGDAAAAGNPATITIDLTATVTQID